MKAFILAAGHGERLRPITETIPKCLVPIQGVPILAVWLEICRHHRIREILINTHSHGNAVRTFLRERGASNVMISEEPKLLGSAGTLLANWGWVEREKDFWVLYGDVLTNVDLSRMLAFHRARSVVATLGVSRVPNPTECGIVSIDHHHIVRSFAEKPTQPLSNLAFSGLLLATPEIFDFIPKHIPADLGFDVLPKLVNRMAAYPISEYLVDVGTSARYQHAQQTWPGLSFSVRG